MLPQSHLTGLIGAKTTLNAKMYPNGETVVYKARGYKPAPMPSPHQYDEGGLFCACMRAYGTLAPALAAGLVLLGSSPLTNFDSLSEDVVPGFDEIAQPKRRYGVGGITSYGARRVRNACYLIENGLPEKFAVFSTTTVPALPFEDMRRLHEKWHVVVDAFRRKLTRRLKDNGLSGDSVSVSEIQGKRYEHTGIPVLHLHTVFRGRRSDGHPAISTEEHDQMWLESLTIAIGGPVPKVSSACNLQWVRNSAEGYLGKYMTKGSQTVRELVAKGFEGWLPKQWWGMSRSLGKKIDHETRRIDDLAEWLNDVANDESSGIWEWHRKVLIEMRSGDTITIAIYGRLSTLASAQIKEFYPKPSG